MRKLGRFALFFVLIGLGALIVGMFAKQPSHERDWKTEYAVLP